MGKRMNLSDQIPELIKQTFKKLILVKKSKLNLIHQLTNNQLENQSQQLDLTNSKFKNPIIKRKSLSMQQAQQQKSLRNRLELGYFRLTHELLKHVKVNEITFAFFRLIQTLQFIHFAFRLRETGEWGNTVFKYSQMIVDYISIDYLIEQSPSIFVSINIGVFALMFLTLVLMVLFGWKLMGQKRAPSLLKSIFPLINFSLYLFKTIFQIPIMTIIFISLIGSFRTALKVQATTLGVLLGVLNLILFFLIQFYLVTSFKDCNPFSQLIHAGQNYTKSLMMLFYKLVFTLYLALDYQSKLGRIFLIVFTVVNVIWAVYGHLQTGFYKYKIRVICLKLHYAVLSFSFICLMKTIRETDEVSILFFLCLNYIMCYIICDYIEKNQCLKALEKQMMFIKDSSDLQAHIIHLIRNIDTFEKRESRVLLEGYLAYHHRQCKLPQTNCICHHLKQVKQRTTEQKYEFFSFVIDILKQNLNRFSDSDAKKIHLLLSFIFQYRQKNRFQAIYSLERTLKQDTFMNRLYYYHQTNLIQSQMIEDDSKDLTNKAVDINKFFDYNNLIVAFEEQLEECSRYHISFWKQLLQVNTDIKKLEKSGTMVTKSKDLVRDQFQKMIAMNPNNVHTLTVYGKFLIDVANQQPSNIKYLQKAQSILKNLKQSSKIDDNSNKYTDNAQTTIIVIDGSQIDLGSIVHTNNYVYKMLGYKRCQLLGTNVNCIMPKVFGESHNQVLEKYLSTSFDKCNGKERMVPALGKDGYMIPVVALTKALANLESGIRIVGFISKLQERPEQEEIVRKYFYLLYRSDNQQVVGITQNCYTDFHIPCCLIYGNPFNNNNELKIRNLFGFSFEKDKQGQVSTALETSQVVLTLNSTKLSEEFIITRTGTNQEIKDDLLHLDSSDFGVEVKIVAKCLLTYNYRGIPLKLLSIYKYGQDCFESKNDQANGEQMKIEETSRYFQKTQNDDFKDLKDFKNFISIKSQPSAISIINNICCVLMFVIASCIITFICIWLSLKGNNQKILDATGKALRNDIVIPNLLFQVQKFYINRQPTLTYTQFNQTASQAKIAMMQTLVKRNQRQFLPIKYYFINDYNKTLTQYSFDTFGSLMTKQVFIDQLVTLYISMVEALMDSQLGTLYTNPLRYDSNPFLMYLSIKNNELFSVRQGSLQTLEEVIVAYDDQVQLHKIVFYVLTAVMLFCVSLWFSTSIPYVLSVTKINNRVLSLVLFMLYVQFSLIPGNDVLRLIGKCYLYMKENLSEAIVSDDDVDEVLEDGPGDGQNQSYMGASSLGLGISSPAPFLGKSSNLDSSPTGLFKKNSSALSQSGSPISVEQKFSKMVNSQNQQKNKTIIQFLVVSLLLIGYFLFNHFYGFSNVNSIQAQIQNLKSLGRRISILTNVKLLLTEYIMNQNYQLTSTLPSIKQLNNRIIEQSYAIERILLKLDIGDEAKTLEKYNSGNLCNFIDQYKDSSIFPTVFNQTECLSLKQGILAKGIKTAIVTMLEEVRTILSMEKFDNRPLLLQQKMVEYEALIKYLESPMLKIIYGTENSVKATNESYQLVLIICSTIFLVIVVGFWRLIWTIYIEELNNKIWRTKGMLNIIPMRIITANELLKNEFASGQLEKAVR